MNIKRDHLVWLLFMVLWCLIPSTAAAEDVYAYSPIGLTNVAIIEKISEGKSADDGYSVYLQYDDLKRITEAKVTDFAANIKETFAVTYAEDGTYSLARIRVEEMPVKEKEIRVFLNRSQLFFDTPPVIIEGRVLVPMRTVFEELGYSVQWDAEKQRVNAVKGEDSVQLDIGDTLAILNDYDSAVEMDVPAQVINGRTMAPLRFVGVCAGCDVLWDESNQAVHMASRDAETTEKTNQKFAMAGKILYADGYKLALDGSTFEEAKFAQSDSMQIDGQYLYYLNEESYLCRFNIEKNETETVTTIPVKSPLVAGGHIYYIKADDASCLLYQANTDGSGEKCIRNDCCGDYQVVEDWVIYKTTDGLCLKEYDMAKDETLTIYDGPVTAFDANHYYVYYGTPAGIRLYSRYEDYNDAITGLMGIDADRIWIYGDDLIYRESTGTDTFAICRYGRFGLLDYFRIPIIENAVGTTELHGNMQFYQVMDESTPQLYMANTDGTGGFPVMALAFASISYSHITGNVPDTEHFDEYLQRDITEHFGNQGKVEYVLLRRLPTQTGTSYPHYYVWVTISDENGNTVTEGAARMHAMDKQGFAVTDFVTKEQILEEPEDAIEMFPPILQKRIRELAES